MSCWKTDVRGDAATSELPEQKLGDQGVDDGEEKHHTRVDDGEEKQGWNCDEMLTNAHVSGRR